MMRHLLPEVLLVLLVRVPQFSNPDQVLSPPMPWPAPATPIVPAPIPPHPQFPLPQSLRPPSPRNVAPTRARGVLLPGQSAGKKDPQGDFPIADELAGFIFFWACGSRFACD